MDNPLWGAPRIDGELVKLGFEVAQSSVAKYMVKRRGPPSQGWLAFLRNHAPDIAAMDFFVVPTIGFDLSLCIRHRSDRPQTTRLDQRHRESDSGMGSPSDHGSISLGRGSGLHDSRPRWYLWRHRHSSIACHGHSGQANRTGFTLAEWRRRTADRIDPPRVLGSHRRFRRGSSAPDPAILRALSQRR